MSLKICVIGGGVIGLSTAVCIQDSLPFAEVTLIGEKFMEHTVSMCAAGYFRPEAYGFQTIDQAIAFYKDSYDHYLSLYHSLGPKKTGITLVTGYTISRNSLQACRNAILEALAPNCRTMQPAELESLFPSGQFKFGVSYTTLLIDPKFYLEYLTQKLVCNGGKIIQGRIESLNSDPILEKFDITVNCTGLGARELCNDHEMVPIRGQTIRISAPWIKHAYFADGVYIIPGADGQVTLGGIKSFGTFNPEVSNHDRQYILENCCQILPSLRGNVHIQSGWVGHRPFRGTIRLEKELIQDDRQCVRKVVHNYGHGAHGVSLSWASAMRATRLVIEMIPSPWLTERAKL